MSEKPYWRSVWLTADCVCFDVDSTLVTEEAINVLADICGCGKRVAEYTNSAMNGETKFEVALQARLDMIRPSKQQIETCLQDHPLVLSPNAKSLIEHLQRRHVDIFLISGGFIQLIAPLLPTLQIPNDHVFANILEFTAEGEYQGFDTTQPTSKSGGKAKALHMIIDKYHYKRIVMIGDGVTDLEARPPASLFIGYGGVGIRDRVKADADYFITDFNALIETF